MRFLRLSVGILPLSLASSGGPTAIDPSCGLVCDEYSAVRTGLGYDLCGPSSSQCDAASNTCTFLYWSTTEDGQQGLINSQVETDLTEDELSNPLLCSRAREMVAHRLAEPAERRRRVTPVQQAPPPPPPAYIAGLRGLANIGNVCYFNTALQILMHLEPVRRELFGNLEMLQQAGLLAVDHDTPMMHVPHVEFLNTLNELYSGMTDYVAGAPSQSPATILGNLVALGYHRFGNVGAPGDMPEALQDVMEAIRLAYQTVQGAPAADFGGLDVVRRTLSVDVETRSVCSHPGCGLVVAGPRITNDVFINIHLQPYMRELTLMEGLNMHFGDGESDLIHHGVAAMTRRHLTNAREIFVAQILRVDQTTGNRINTQIAFPSGPADLLDLSPFFAPGAAAASNPLYRLVAIAHHNGGHYFAELEHEGNWYRVDDHLVVPMAGPPAGPSATATMLFYQRVAAPAPITAAAPPTGLAAAGGAGQQAMPPYFDLDFSALLAAFAAAASQTSTTPEPTELI